MKPLTDSSAQPKCGKTQKKPEQRKRQTDLPVQIQRHVCIIPYVPPENEIVNDPHHHLCTGDQQCPRNSLKYQRTRGICCNAVKHSTGNPAQKCHGPVSVAPEYNFQKTVNQTADEEQVAKFIQGNATLHGIPPM